MARRRRDSSILAMGRVFGDGVGQRRSGGSGPEGVWDWATWCIANVQKLYGERRLPLPGDQKDWRRWLVERAGVPERNVDSVVFRNCCMRARRWFLRQVVLSAYGHTCSCCGEGREAFLVLDHIDGGGAGHRRDLGGGGGERVYRDVIKQGCPADRYQILCHNCNAAKERPGGCPHKQEGSHAASR